MEKWTEKLFKGDFLVRGNLSRSIGIEEKVLIQPLMVKGKKVFQFTVFKEKKAFHSNFTEEEAQKALNRYLDGFKEAHFFTVEADLLALKEKGKWRVIEKKATKKMSVGLHNRKKKYLLEQEGHGGFWRALGIAGADGQIKKDKQAKFRQVNRFIEIVDSVLLDLKKESPLRIVDFGCGKAYLTFALYHYLVKVLKMPVDIVGIDLKKDVVENLENIRRELDYQDLKFVHADIKTFNVLEADMVISLHACDTATDLVLEKAIEAEAKVILAVPCCHHELYTKIKQPLLHPLLKHGILKERFSALATDALRALLLEDAGYSTHVIEFVDTEHTPKNLMIKAVRTGSEKSNKQQGDFLRFLMMLGEN